jgi:endonuclease/exonuclease/phosphatase family metal-dependent hydrolase
MSRLRLLSYNTHLFGTTLPGAIGLTDLYFQDSQRLDQIIERVRASDADIVGLCEVWPDEYKQQIIERAGYPYSFFTPEPNLLTMVTKARPLGDGLLVLSRLPMQQQASFFFQHLAGIDKRSHKGALVLLFDGSEGRQFRLVFTHTQATDEHLAERHANLQQVRGVLSAYHPGTPAIVLGDLNVPGSQYPQLMALFHDFRDSQVEADPGAPGYTCDPRRNALARRWAQETPERYDYILVSAGDWRVESFHVHQDWQSQGSGVSQHLSDHDPVQAELTLLRQASAPGYFDTQGEAEEVAKHWKALFGDGCSAHVVIHNNTDAVATLGRAISHRGPFWLLPARRLPAGKYTAVFQPKPLVQETGPYGALVYRLGDADLFISYRVPWKTGIGLLDAFAKDNKLYAEVREHGHWDSHTLDETMFSRLNHGEPSIDTRRLATPSTRYRVRGSLRGDTTSPFITFVLEQ